MNLYTRLCDLLDELKAAENDSGVTAVLLDVIQAVADDYEDGQITRLLEAIIDECP